MAVDRAVGSSAAEGEGRPLPLRHEPYVGSRVQRRPAGSEAAEPAGLSGTTGGPPSPRNSLVEFPAEEWPSCGRPKSEGLVGCEAAEPARPEAFGLHNRLGCGAASPTLMPEDEWSAPLTRGPRHHALRHAPKPAGTGLPKAVGQSQMAIGGKPSEQEGLTSGFRKGRSPFVLPKASG